ncbi:exodeoxyribonuclease III [Nonomuraea cavernae]|uniref:Exodeoxyribonuclease III n=1 Tax=Nonomuraea cavernae TaxID=2045107 RepID=A0A917YWU0_9ACTN|nr:exodeoxyribonuclease III [Nonomuraea cavernae]MCA2185592.1 exodeoxyribonuclease III [Nonomuraea cavernae]GGO66926.1 exodeoxyribonuclease III [Nonomuraea cavernae]
MRLATWNVNSVKARLPRLVDWLAGVRPDVVCLQETKCAAGGFPVEQVGELGYAVAAHGDGRWNGVALLSRVGLDEVSRGFPGEPGFDALADGVPPESPESPETGAGSTPPEARAGGTGAAPPEARAIGATCGGLRVWSLYAPNGRTVDSPHYRYKLAWFAAFREALESELATGSPLVACGDYNVAPTDADVWDPAQFAGSTHVTPAERQALAGLRELGLRDVVPTAMKGPHPFTYWDYRAGMFHQNKGMRIDLVYAAAGVADRVRSAYVDREARKGKAPSDHAPIVVDLDL